MNRLVYLAGPISGQTYGGATDWRKEAIQRLEGVGLIGLSPMRGKDYLLTETNVADKYDDYILSTGRGIMTRDYYDCNRAACVLANFLGAEKVSIGTAMEIAWAYQSRVPVVAIMEESGNLHDHAMIREAIGYRVTTLDEGIYCVNNLVNPVPHVERPVVLTTGQHLLVEERLR